MIMQIIHAIRQHPHVLPRLSLGRAGLGLARVSQAGLADACMTGHHQQECQHTRHLICLSSLLVTSPQPVRHQLQRSQAIINACLCGNV